jgi:glycosyltransferase, group 1 family
MKIVYCYPSLHSKGGIERITSLKANYLSSYGYDVIIVTTDQQGKPSAYPLDDRVKIYDLAINYSSNWNRSLIKRIYHKFYDLRKHKKALIKLLKEIEPDCIISLFRNETIMISRLNMPIKKIVEFHFARPYLQFQYRKGVKGIFDRWYFKQMIASIKKYDKFIVLTHEDALNWKGFTNLVVMPNFCSFNYEQPAHLNKKRVIAVGHYIPIKGFERLIDAWAIVNQKVSDWELHIIGEGPLRGKLQTQINELELSQSVFLNGKSDNIKDEYTNSSILAVSSLSEGISHGHIGS